MAVLLFWNQVTIIMRNVVGSKRRNIIYNNNITMQ